MKLDKQFWTERLGKGWAMKLKDTLKSPYMEKLMNFLQTEYALNTIYPDRKEVFRAFKECPWENLKVVIIGQDPYYNGEANGLCFANNEFTTYRSASLCKIHQKLEREYHDGLYLDFDFSLRSWADQGVLLLNTALTVRERSPGSHTVQWKSFTKAVIESINEYQSGIVFMLWGGHAKAFAPYISSYNHILTSEHPAYAIRQGNREWKCNNFKQVDTILKEKYGEMVHW